MESKLYIQLSLKDPSLHYNGDWTCDNQPCEKQITLSCTLVKNVILKVAIASIPFCKHTYAY